MKKNMIAAMIMGIFITACAPDIVPQIGEAYACRAFNSGRDVPQEVRYINGQWVYRETIVLGESATENERIILCGDPQLIDGIER